MKHKEWVGGVALVCALIFSYIALLVCVQAKVPEQAQIAFSTTRDGNYEVYVMDEDGGNPRNLTDHPATDWFPSWSPGGQRIAFTSDRDGNYEIYVMDSDGRTK